MFTTRGGVDPASAALGVTTAVDTFNKNFNNTTVSQVRPNRLPLPEKKQ